MPRKYTPKEPLRPLSEMERAALERLSRSPTALAVEASRANMLLAVAGGATLRAAALAGGRKDPDTVAALIRRFNAMGLAALPSHQGEGGGRPPTYGPAERQRILHEARRTPTPEEDGTASWSLTTLQRSLRRTPAGLPRLGRSTIARILQDNRISWQRDRSWVDTGHVERRRKEGLVAVTDPDADPKKS